MYAVSQNVKFDRCLKIVFCRYVPLLLAAMFSSQNMYNFIIGCKQHGRDITFHPKAQDNLQFASKVTRDLRLHRSQPITMVLIYSGTVSLCMECHCHA